MIWEEKIRMAKEADPSLTDEKAAEVVHDLEQLAHLALEDFIRRKQRLATLETPPEPQNSSQNASNWPDRNT